MTFEGLAALLRELKAQARPWSDVDNPGAWVMVPWELLFELFEWADDPDRFEGDIT